MRRLFLWPFVLATVPLASPANRSAPGALQHDTSVLSSRVEHDTDVNLEWRGSQWPVPAFVPSFITAGIRPFAGYSGHLPGDSTDEIYGGGSFDLIANPHWDFNLSLGLAAHDGKLHGGNIATPSASAFYSMRASKAAIGGAATGYFYSISTRLMDRYPAEIRASITSACGTAFGLEATP